MMRPALGLACVVVTSCVPASAPDAGPSDPVGCTLQNDCGEETGRPGRRSELDGIYDPRAGRMIIFGGTTAIPVECNFPAAEYTDETWAFFDRCGIWKQLTGPSPGLRSRHMMAYDSGAHRALLYGGRYRAGTTGLYTVFGDLWELDLGADSWSELSTTGAPPARVHAAFEVNGNGTKAYLFGGNKSPDGTVYDVQNDLWELDLANLSWTKLTPAGPAPDARQWFGSLFDVTRDRFVVFGGSDNNAFFSTDYKNDVWAYDVSSGAWQRLHDGASPAPAGRFGPEWVHDSESDTYLLFGGHDDTNLGNSNDLWAFSPASNTWEQLRPGDTYNKQANGFCDFPPDFTVVDQDSPERRNAFAAVYSSNADCPALLVTMGKTDCGAADDVQRYVPTERRWDLLLEAREGEMCLRTNTEFDCFEMCE
ncbi:MAG: Kelch repeat-containing protein [Myxococcota bacterium]